MTNINLDLAAKLDGSETHMIAVLVDSWGDKLVIPLNCEMAIEPANYFTPCAHCGNAVLDCNFTNGSDCCDRCNEGRYHTKTKKEMLDMCLTQTLPEDLIEVKAIKEVKQEILSNKKEIHMNTVNVSGRIIVNESLDMEERITIAVEAANEMFWDIIAKSFPDSVDGSFLMSDMDDVMLSWVKHWVENNVPSRQCYRGEYLTGLDLHYDHMWHLMHTGGGCMVGVSDSVVVDGKHNYIGVDSEHVCIYTDTFKQDDFMQEHLASWAFGDNPTVLMNMIDEYLGGPALFDTGELFDDIMTIGKSSLV